jgi:hypothetical protein
MAAKSSYLRILSVFLLMASWAAAFLQPGTAQQSQTGILEPEAPKEEPSIWATPLELDFGPVGVGESSETQVVTITNTGTALLANFSGGSVPAPFHMANNCEVGVLPQKNCQYSFWVTPPSAGDLNTSTTINTNAGPFTIMLHAQGINPEFTVSPLSLDFGTVVTTTVEMTEASLAAPQIVVFRNIGMAEISGFSSGSVKEPFEVSNDCPSSLSPGEECRYYYNFVPKVADSFSDTSTVSTNAGSFTIKMTGKGASLPFSGQWVTPLEIDFGPVGVNNPAKTQEVVLTNLSVSEPIDGFDSSELEAPFNMSQDCTPSVDPRGSCTYTFSFAPMTVKDYQATFTTTNSAGNFEILLRGEGFRPQLSVSPLALDFGPVAVGDTSSAQTVIVKNTGKSTVTGIITYNVNPPFSGSQTCANGLIPGDTCELDFYYTPVKYGEVFTTTIITTAQMSSGIEISMTGGVKPPKVSKQFIPDTIPVGGTSALALTISNPNPAATHFDVAITDSFPAGMVIATPLHFSASPECGTPTFLPVAGTDSFSLKDATILGGKTCKIQLHVTAPLARAYKNTTGVVTSRDGPGNSAEATLKVMILNYIPYIGR